MNKILILEYVNIHVFLLCILAYFFFLIGLNFGGFSLSFRRCEMLMFRMAARVMASWCMQGSEQF